MKLIPGYYTGTCTNTTFFWGITAKIVLRIDKIENGCATGDLGIFGPLDGGSAFSGKTAGPLIEFKTEQGITSIVWRGTVTNRSIDGSYKVANRIGFITIPEKGTWKCSFAHELEAIDADATKIQIRYADGAEESLTAATFWHNVDSGRWSANDAVSVRLRDGGDWISIQDVATLVGRKMSEVNAAPEEGDIVGDVSRKVITGIASSIILSILGFSE
jgi:hypothetical protein